MWTDEEVIELLERIKGEIMLEAFAETYAGCELAADMIEDEIQLLIKEPTI